MNIHANGISISGVCVPISMSTSKCKETYRQKERGPLGPLSHFSGYVVHDVELFDCQVPLVHQGFQRRPSTFQSRPFRSIAGLRIERLASLCPINVEVLE